MTISSLGIWGLSAVFFISIISGLPNEFTTPAGLIGQGILLGFGIWACKDGVPAPKGTHPVSIPIHLCRGLLSASAVGGSALISTLGFPILAGMASVFPAMFLTSMLSVWLAQGEAVQAGAVGPMMLGSSSVGVYGLLCILTFPVFGPFVGGCVAWVGAILLISVPAWFWIKRD